MENLLQVNYLAVLLAIAVNQVIGALWYSPILFGKVWMKELGIAPDSIAKTDAQRSMLLAFIYSILNFLLLAYFIQVVETKCPAKGLMVGFFLGLFSAIQIGINATFESKSMKLFLINALYPLLSYSLGGLIIGVWN
ncbi:MAG TPA: DUF1761 domain-containing protein [Bacteroidales bacterium]|jgi:hypothetical protein|nr:DUF1761 domain-containing protein [Bacteroidales bacterium]